MTEGKGRVILGQNWKMSFMNAPLQVIRPDMLKSVWLNHLRHSYLPQAGLFGVPSKYLHLIFAQSIFRLNCLDKADAKSPPVNPRVYIYRYNTNFSYFPNEEHLSGICFFGINWTNLSLTSVDLIFYTPNVANLGIWKIWPILSLYVYHLLYSTEKV